MKRTRIGTIWAAAGLFAVTLLLLLIFILENGQRVSISYVGAHGHLPLGVALLLAAVLGILLVVIPGTGQVIQLRITACRTGASTPRMPLRSRRQMPREIRRRSVHTIRAETVT